MDIQNAPEQAQFAGVALTLIQANGWSAVDIPVMFSVQL